MYQRFQNGNADTSNMVKYWATFIVLLVPISIAARIIITIFFHIGFEVVNAAKGEESDNSELVDEYFHLNNGHVVFYLLGISFILGIAIL